MIKDRPKLPLQDFTCDGLIPGHPLLVLASVGAR